MNARNAKSPKLEAAIQEARGLMSRMRRLAEDEYLEEWIQIEIRKQLRWGYGRHLQEVRDWIAAIQSLLATGERRVEEARRVLRRSA